MKYLGIDITKYDCDEKCYIGIDTYENLECAKHDIRKRVLPTYQPTKTLEWLEEQTGKKWKFEYTFNMLYVLNNGQYEEIYDFSDNNAYTINSKLGVTVGDELNGRWVEITPREFVEKIAKGEWV